MNNEYKPVLICNGNEHDLKNHGELICGGCGYVFDSNEAEELFKMWSLSLVVEGLGAIYIRQRLYAVYSVFKSLKKYTSANVMRHFIFICHRYLKNVI